MIKTQHITSRCPVYLHPAACTSPAAVEAIQKHTGLLVIVTPGARLVSAKAVTALTDPAPFGGDAA